MATILPLLVALLAPAAQPAGGATEGAPVPAFLLPTLNAARSGVQVFSTRNVVGLQAGEAARPLVLSFVASFCEPCKREVPALAEALARHPHAAAAIVITDRDEPGREAMRRWLVEALDLPLPVVADRYALVARRFGVAELPFLVVVGRDGVVRWVSRGFHEDTLARLEARLAELRP